MNRIILDGLDGDDFFEWFHNVVRDGGGDTIAAIASKNPKETHECFIHWYEGMYGLDNCPDCIRLPDIYTDAHIHCLTGLQDAMIFCSDPNIKLPPGDYLFVVREDCFYGCSAATEVTIKGFGDEVK